MNLVVFAFMVLLFVALTPGIFLTLPSGASKTTVAFVHGIVFALVWWVSHKAVWEASLSILA
jgi:hypothetical protein